MIEGARRSARWRLAERGLPRPGDEDWRFTPLAAILGKSYTAARPAGLTEAELEGLCLAPLDGYRLVFDNGRLAAELSRLPQGLRCGGLADEIDEALLLGPEEAGFGALAAARFCDGPYVVIPKGMKLDAPLHVVTVATSAEEQPREAHYRGVVVLEPGAEAVIVEEAVGRGGGEFFTNSVTRCELAEGSRLELYRLMRETEPLVSVHGLRARLGRDAGLRSHVVGLGGALARCDADVVLAGEGCEAELNGLYLACRRQHLDFHTRVVHAVPRGRSRELYKGVLDGQARSVFDGLVEVLPGAQKTDAHVYNK
ncbi:MAG: SufD family Fe-S cluster assembly protein, partial [Elusimicrobia bacterium]|nr:SufD family Fe-S cluster assembly protein [Elusimicrobiota bacterium]